MTVTIEGKISPSEYRVVPLDPSDVEFLHDLAFSVSRKYAPQERWAYWPSEGSEPLSFDFQCYRVADLFRIACHQRLIKADNPVAG
jgi:hypothetical protein